MKGNGKVEKKEVDYGIGDENIKAIDEFLSEFFYIRDKVREYDKSIDDERIVMIFSIWRKDHRSPGTDSGSKEKETNGQHKHNRPVRKVATENMMKKLYALLKAKQEAGKLSYDDVNRLYNEAKEMPNNYEHVKELIDELEAEGY